MEIGDDGAAVRQEQRITTRALAPLLEGLDVAGDHAVEPADPIRAAHFEQPAVVHLEEADPLPDPRRTRAL